MILDFVLVPQTSGSALKWPLYELFLLSFIKERSHMSQYITSGFLSFIYFLATEMSTRGHHSHTNMDSSIAHESDLNSRVQDKSSGLFLVPFGTTLDSHTYMQLLREHKAVSKNLPARVCVWKKTLQAMVEDMSQALQQPWCLGTSVRG